MGLRDAVERKLEAGVGGRKSSGKRERVWLTAKVGVLVLDAGEGGEIDGVRREGLCGNARIAGKGVWRERRCSCVELGLQVDRWARAGEIEHWRGGRWGVVEGRSV